MISIIPLHIELTFFYFNRPYLHENITELLMSIFYIKNYFKILSQTDINFIIFQFETQSNENQCPKNKTINSIKLPIYDLSCFNQDIKTAGYHIFTDLLVYSQWNVINFYFIIAIAYNILLIGYIFMNHILFKKHSDNNEQLTKN